MPDWIFLTEYCFLAESSAHEALRLWLFTSGRDVSRSSMKSLQS